MDMRHGLGGGGVAVTAKGQVGDNQVMNTRHHEWGSNYSQQTKKCVSSYRNKKIWCQLLIKKQVH